MKFVTLPERIDQLVKQYGSLRKAAIATGISVSYLCRLRAVTHDHPGQEILEKLGLIKHRLYTRK